MSNAIPQAVTGININSTVKWGSLSNYSTLPCDFLLLNLEAILLEYPLVVLQFFS
jgi:hypothetical protein